MKRIVPAAVLLALAAAHLPARASAQAVEREPARTGGAAPQRRIAPVMSAVYADWLTRPERVREEQPDRLVRALKIPKGAVVVDLGAGVGYFTWRLARQVGPSGKVIAVDIQQRMLDLLTRNMARRGIRNVEIVLGAEDDPRLPEGKADLVLLVDVYHELARPQAIMRRVRRSLKPDGRLVLVEYRKEDPTIPIHPLHKMTVGEARAEIEPVGFRFHELMSFLPRQHVIVFKPDGRR